MNISQRLSFCNKSLYNFQVMPKPNVEMSRRIFTSVGLHYWIMVKIKSIKKVSNKTTNALEVDNATEASDEVLEYHKSLKMLRAT